MKAHYICPPDNEHEEKIILFLIAYIFGVDKLYFYRDA